MSNSFDPKNKNINNGRDAGDDALAEPNPHDSRMDEKVVVNEQAENKVVNAPSQSDAHPTEGVDRVDEI